MRILITGANGFVGYYLAEACRKAGHDVFAASRTELDFTNPYSVHDAFEQHQPEVVVHCGAMSKPDDCELDPWKAYMVNVEGTVHLLTNAAEYNSFFIFLSTDFVFNGETGMYQENDERDPVNVYGKTKMEAEDAVMEYPFSWAIVRTVLVYGNPLKGRQNILTIVKEKLSAGEAYAVFADQVRTPTYVEDLVKGIVAIVERSATGIFHLAGKDVITPYEMAVKTAEFLGLDKSLIKKVTAADMQQAARRPLKTGFVIEKAVKELNYSPVGFDEGLRKTFSSS
jgi:dTDP-4-dehydrorhamnose reductase